MNAAFCAKRETSGRRETGGGDNFPSLLVSRLALVSRFAQNAAFASFGP